ncbi:DUF5686 and carboxypeptidase-like regulatory domain-containing protein [Parapedobacter koreensis]|uniref:CarboxypepD_reg-like domain-containing protein n=1 Tax=Parapedobacter koreensis TaxID=332977 RepID=A0A1H7T9M4_9SPHI|nr:DUF5686 and carboxypeptidase-like regulatory domain-containing protein [Parapedobacter koreensis]SEL81433.1 CarboxypepD_reg-like domain-containing protein [Parapedobacter koreensis]
MSIRCINVTIVKTGLVISGVILTLSVALAQITVSGTVTDAATGVGIAGVTVSLPNASKGTSTDSAGHYRIQLEATATHIRFNALGYKPMIRQLVSGISQTIDVELDEDAQTLDEVVVSGKGRYRNRDNPAVELIRQVIAHKRVNRPSRFDYVSFDAYEKIMMAVSDVPKSITNNALTRGYRFALENVDTTLVPGRSLLPIYLEESLSQRYERLHPKAGKTIVTAHKKTELDQRYVNNQNIETYFKFIHTDVDIYENNILILNKPFLGPTADAAPLFYKFFITDTISNAEGQFVELTFIPRNEEDRLFSGKLQVTLDGNYGIRRADIWIDHRANLNWVNQIDISLRFSRHRSGIYLLAYSDVQINFGLFEGKRGAFGQRTLAFENYDTETAIPSGTFSGQQWVKADDAELKTESHWQDKRPVQLTEVEAKTYVNIDSLHRNRAFRRTLKLGYLLSQSFLYAGPVEFGPVEYSYTHNDLEGSRIRLSGRTTRQFSEQLYGEAYTAYGFRDNRIKVFGSLAHTLNGHRVGEYPAHYLQATYHQDAREPGQLLGFRNGDSFTRSFRSGEQYNWLYHHAFRLNHVIEFGNHVMLQTFLAMQRQAPAARLHFVTAGPSADTLGALRTSELGLDLRWAPNEEFYQRNLERTPIINEYPVFNLRYNMGLSGILGGEYNYHALRLNVFKRVFLSQLGLADVNVGTGYIFGTVPYPLLDIPNASQTYVLTPDAFSLMNNLEFVSDQYIKLNIEYRLHGFILNKIPLLKKLKIRELAGFKLLYGNVRPENQPQHNPDVFLLPTDEQGRATTFALTRKPYMEASVGLENILNVLRVEYVRRLSYLDHPDIDKGGIRFSVKVDF